MKYQKLELHIAQVERAILSCKSTFPHNKKQEIYDSLIKLFEGIKSSSYSGFNAEVLNYTKHTLNLVFYGIQHLHYEREEDIPKRLIFCLNLVINDWIDNGTDHYYIVISQNDKIDEFLIRALDEGQIAALNRWFITQFKCEYKQSLIQISKPKLLFDDFLGSTPVYHELGHFIDKNYQITKMLFRKPEFFGKNESHYGEYFADIFAAQYIGLSSVEPLNYIAFESLNDDKNPTHPSNEMRIKVVRAFLTGSGGVEEMDIVKALKEATLERCNRELKNRCINLTSNPFATLDPIALNSVEEVHSLFSEGWNHWLDGTSPIRQKFTNATECCNALNDLIKNSLEMTIAQPAVVN